MAIFEPGLGEADRRLTPGSRLGRFEILGLLSVGGMAEVYLARSDGIAGFAKRTVVKRMLPRLAREPEYIDMFLAEARLAARLEHPNVVQVYDIGEETGNYFYVMEYVRGPDLRDVMKVESARGNAVPIPCALSIGLGLAAGLDYAHRATDASGRELGVVHRDVSLSNVLVSFEGAVKLIDFGVARLCADAGRTRAGALKGKTGYMSPEQCLGEPLDRRSDVFAIGVVLFELTTGHRLFQGESDLSVLQQTVHNDAPRPSLYRPDYPFALESIVMRALERDRRQRYPSAAAMQRDLERYARDVGGAASASELGQYVRELFPRVAAEPEPRPPTPTPTTVSVRDPRDPSGGAWELPPSADSAVPDLRGWRRGSPLVVIAMMAALTVALMALWPTGSPSAPPVAARVAPAQTPGLAAAKPVPAAAVAPAPASPDAAVVEDVVSRPASPRPPPSPPAEDASKIRPPVAPPVDAGASAELALVVRLLEVDVRGAVHPVLVRRGVGSIKDGYRACYQRAAGLAGRSPRGVARIRFRIDDSGAATDVEVDGAPLPGLAACLETETARMHCQVGPDLGDARVTVEVEFDPRG